MDGKATIKQPKSKFFQQLINLYREIESAGTSSEVRGRVDGWGDSFSDFGRSLSENENRST